MREDQYYVVAGIGGSAVSQTVEGRERYDIRIRLPRSWRNNPERLEQILITTSAGTDIPLGELAQIVYEEGPVEIKSEDGFRSEERRVGKECRSRGGRQR